MRFQKVTAALKKDKILFPFSFPYHDHDSDEAEI